MGIEEKLDKSCFISIEEWGKSWKFIKKIWCNLCIPSLICLNFRFELQLVGGAFPVYPTTNKKTKIKGKKKLTKKKTTTKFNLISFVGIYECIGGVCLDELAIHGQMKNKLEIAFQHYQQIIWLSDIFAKIMIVILISFVCHTTWIDVWIYIFFCCSFQMRFEYDEWKKKQVGATMRMRMRTMNNDNNDNRKINNNKQKNHRQTDFEWKLCRNKIHYSTFIVLSSKDLSSSFVFFLCFILFPSSTTTMFLFLRFEHFYE